MIDFSTDSDTELILDAVRRYAQETLAPQQRAFEAARSLPAATLKQLQQMGLELACWSEQDGGSGLNWANWLQVLAELAQGDAATAIVIDQAGRSYDALQLAGQHTWIERFLQPERTTPVHAVLVHDLQGVLRGYETGHLHGTLPWVNTAHADVVIVAHPTGVCVVGEGFSLQPVPGLALQAAGASAIQFEHAPVLAHQADSLLAEHVLAHSRLRQAAVMLGVLEAASTYARQYALERVAFGKPIAHHQALAFLLVDMYSAVEQTRLLIQEAACQIDSGTPALQACNQAFIQACEAGRFIGPNAVQVLGAAGFMRDYPVEKYMRELTALSLPLGGADAARQSLYVHAALPETIEFLRLETESE